MPVAGIFVTQLLFGYLVWTLVVVTYVLPWLRSLGRFEAQRAIAALNAFRFFGLVFILPGVIGPHLPTEFAVPAAYADFATSILAIFAFVLFPIRPLFLGFVVAFNVVGAADLIIDTFNAIHFGLPPVAGQLGAAYAIPIIYVPLLMISHVVAFYLLFAPSARATSAKAASHSGSYSSTY
ncbi:MAG TPA: hypothetical protein VHS56_14575 [Candidatus Cybelea sp.]|jgi:hypothetical protein|nr:hypothetical protein [Candidatus Cybelea sp.]